ncbi:MAG: hypothetical protein KJ063_01760 [Anaerolineae bacterium]|nr:hypothetical protein [Anaerolineae bacterium]
MDYGMIGKIEKAKIYAEERNRFKFDAFTVRLAGDNDTVHLVGYTQGDWDCDCNFFASRGRCSHTMAVEHLLDGMFD